MNKYEGEAGDQWMSAMGRTQTFGLDVCNLVERASSDCLNAGKRTARFPPGAGVRSGKSSPAPAIVRP
jgi:hypothetical protein